MEISLGRALHISFRGRVRGLGVGIRIWREQAELSRKTSWAIMLSPKSLPILDDALKVECPPLGCGTGSLYPCINQSSNIASPPGRGHSQKVSKIVLSHSLSLQPRVISREVCKLRLVDSSIISTCKRQS